MKNILFISLCLLMIFSFYNTAAAADITISGSSQFDCSLLAKYMKKHGYSYVGETINKYELIVNTYAAKAAEIIVLDEAGNVLGTAVTDNKGGFSVTVPKEDVYKVVVTFKGQETEKVVKFPEIKDVMINVGYFNSTAVDVWLQTASLRD